MTPEIVRNGRKEARKQTISQSLQQFFLALHLSYAPQSERLENTTILFRLLYTFTSSVSNLVSQNEMMWTAGIQMKWVCDHRSAKKPEKKRGGSPEILFFGLFRNCLNCDSQRWSHTHFICIPAVHIISFCVSFLSRVDELNKLAGLQCMGLHSSGW